MLARGVEHGWVITTAYSVFSLNGGRGSVPAGVGTGTAGWKAMAPLVPLGEMSGGGWVRKVGDFPAVSASTTS